MRYKPEHKANTRARVVAEAGKALRKDGPHRVSLAAIMKRAGLTHGGFYGYFPSRDALLSTAIEKMFEGSQERWANHTRGRSPAAGLASYIDWYLSPGHRDSRESGCTIAALASDLPRLSRACKKTYSDGARALDARIAEHLTALGHPASLSSSILSELVGALSLARIETDARRSGAILATSRKAIKERLGLPR